MVLAASFYTANGDDSLFALWDASKKAGQGGASIQPTFYPDEGREGLVGPRQFAHDAFEGGLGHQRHARLGRSVSFGSFHVAIPTLEPFSPTIRLLLPRFLFLGRLTWPFSTVFGFHLVEFLKVFFVTSPHFGDGVRKRGSRRSRRGQSLELNTARHGEGSDNGFNAVVVFVPFVFWSVPTVSAPCKTLQHSVLLLVRFRWHRLCFTIPCLKNEDVLSSSTTFIMMDVVHDALERLTR